MKKFLYLLTSFSLLFVHGLSLAADNDKATVASKTLSNSPLNSTALVETLLGLGTVLAIIVLLRQDQVYISIHQLRLLIRKIL